MAKVSNLLSLQKINLSVANFSGLRMKEGPFLSYL